LRSNPEDDSASEFQHKVDFDILNLSKMCFSVSDYYKNSISSDSIFKHSESVDSDPESSKNSLIANLFSILGFHLSVSLFDSEERTLFIKNHVSRRKEGIEISKQEKLERPYLDIDLLSALKNNDLIYFDNSALVAVFGDDFLTDFVDMFPLLPDIQKDDFSDFLKNVFGKLKVKTREACAEYSLRVLEKNFVNLKLKDLSKLVCLGEKETVNVLENFIDQGRLEGKICEKKGILKFKQNNDKDLESKQMVERANDVLERIEKVSDRIEKYYILKE